MKRLVCRTFDGTGGLAVEAAPDPTPAADEVVIRVTAANVTFVEVMLCGQ